jgi:glutathione synthase/RimK-type ligase-like ATP-grasp enzyme
VKFVLATCRTKPTLTPGDGLLAAALRRLGAAAVAAPWDAVDPTRVEGMVCLRSTWDYHLRWDEFSGWVRRFEDTGRLWNPPATVLWNADKVYLRDLALAGIALPRTRWFEPGERPAIGALLEEWGESHAVLKPRVSATAFGTHVVTRDRGIGEADWPALDRSGCMLQLFVPEIQSRGESSLVFLRGGFSHGVLKRPGPGDFRVQTDFGGSLETATPADPAIEFAEAVLAAAGRPWLYARVDLVETDDGPVLMELELIEPDLFLTPGGAARLAEGLIESVRETA